MKLGLGTVQFGLDYGVSNSRGVTPHEEARLVLRTAAAAGIDMLDTAPAYGDAESVIGELAGEPFQVVTKTVKTSDPGGLERGLEGSLRALRRDSVYGLLSHDSDALMAPGGEMLFERMRGLRDRGLVRKVGVSVYTPAQAEALLGRYPIDIVQIPVNVFDQQLVRSGALQRLAEAGVEVHARSVFLQGLLLLDPVALPSCFDGARPLLAAFRAHARETGLSPLAAALGFVAGLPGIERAIVGVNTREQLLEVIAAFRPLPAEEFGSFACDDEAVIDPSRWPAGVRV